MLHNMPNEVGLRILSYLTTAALLRCLCVCTTTCQAMPAVVAAKDGQTPTRSTTLNWQAAAKEYSDDVGAWFEESLNPGSVWSRPSGSSNGLFWFSFQLWDLCRITVHFGPRESNQTPANELKFFFFFDPFGIQTGDPRFGTQLPQQITCAALRTAQKVILSHCDIQSFGGLVAFESLEWLEIETCRFTDGTALGGLVQLKNLKKIRIRECQNKERQYIGIVAYIRSAAAMISGRPRPWQSPNVGNAELNVKFAEQKEHGRAFLCEINTCVESFYADAGVTTGMKLVSVQGIDVDHQGGFEQAMELLKCALGWENLAERIWLEFEPC